jgi:hypothetical protein
LIADPAQDLPGSRFSLGEVEANMKNTARAADFRIASEQPNFGVNFGERGSMGETCVY